DTGVLVISWGRCGRGVAVYDPVSIIPIASARSLGSIAATTNVAVRRDDVLFTGDELGDVGAWDLAADPAKDLSISFIARITGHSEVEIRALWTDGIDDLIFAGSSRNSPTMRGPTLPAFFVLELTETPPAVT